MKYKIGQIITSSEDTVIETLILGKKITIPKGSKIIIGADNMAHIRHKYIQAISDDDEIDGYDPRGIADYIYTILRERYPIDEMLDGYDESKDRFVEEIELALEDIGFY